MQDVCDRVGVGIASSATHAYRDSGIPLIRNTNISAGKIDTTDLIYIDPDFDRLNRTKRVVAGDVITARTGIPGASAVIPPELDEAQTFTTLISTPKPEQLDSTFLCWWINGMPGQKFINSRKMGGIQQNMNATLLSQMPIRLPPINIQKAIAKRIEESISVHQKLEERLASARQIASKLREYALSGSRM